MRPSILSAWIMAACIATLPANGMVRSDPADPYSSNILPAANPKASKKARSEPSKRFARAIDALLGTTKDSLPVKSYDAPLEAIPEASTPPADLGIARFVVLGSRLLLQTKDGAVFLRGPSDTQWSVPAAALTTRLEVYGVDSSTVVQNYVGSLRLTLVGRDDSGGIRLSDGPTLPSPELLFPAHMAFLSASTGIVGNVSNQALRFTRDGGRIWSNPTPQVYSDNLQGPRWRRVQTLAADSLAFLVGDGGNAARFDFKTAKLSRFQAPHPRTLVAVHFTSAAHGVVADDSGHLHTTFDSAATWTSTRLDTASDFRIADLAFADADHGFACGTDGAAFETIDGGRTWQRITRTEAVRNGTYRRLPPPLYYLLIALAVFVV